jgi:protein-L-isoaspartate(D-aspartate) O-methyltransferase
MNLEQARFNMIEQQIRTWDVLDQRVLDTLAILPRDEFVPQGYRELAYADIRIPLGHGEVMMTPKVEARMVQTLRLKDSDRVLEIGTGSGYVTALMAKLAGHVYSMELYEDLSAAASERLAKHGIDNVNLHVDNGVRGWPGEQPYDAIAVTGSMPMLMDDLLRQLRIGGRLFVIVGQPPIMEALLITRAGAQDWSRESIFDTDLPPLREVPQPRQFVL